MDPVCTILIVFLCILLAVLIALVVLLVVPGMQSRSSSTQSQIDEIRRLAAQARREIDAATRDYLREVYQQIKEG